MGLSGMQSTDFVYMISDFFWYANISMILCLDSPVKI